MTAISGSVHPSARVFTSSKHSPDRTTLTPVFTSYSSLHVSPWDILSGDAPNHLSLSAHYQPTISPETFDRRGFKLDSPLKISEVLRSFFFLFTIQSHICTNSFLPCSPINAGSFEDVTFLICSWNQPSDLFGGDAIGVGVFSLSDDTFGGPALQLSSG